MVPALVPRWGLAGCQSLTHPGFRCKLDSFSLLSRLLLEPFQLPFVQRGLIEVLILAVPAGLLGTWIVLRGLAFFSHAVGTAAFPGLVLADGLGFAAPLGAFGAALAFTAGASALTGPAHQRGRRRGPRSRRLPRRGRDPRQRRLRLGIEHRDAAVRQPAPGRRRRSRARRRRRRRDPSRQRPGRSALAAHRLRPDALRP